MYKRQGVCAHDHHKLSARAVRSAVQSRKRLPRGVVADVSKKFVPRRANFFLSPAPHCFQADFPSGCHLLLSHHGVVHFRLHGKCHHDNAVRRRSQARALMACLHRQVRTAIVGQDPLFALLPCERSFVLTGLISLRCSGKTPRILEQKNQLPLVRGRRLEAETTIERLSICVDGVCQQSPNPRVLSNGNRSANRCV